MIYANKFVTLQQKRKIMGKQETPNYRGKGSSETKFTKAGEPKRTGNWSYFTIHHQSLSCKDYRVKYKEYESGVKILVVGKNDTPLSQIMGEHVATLAMQDPNFDCYKQSGYKQFGNKQYNTFRELRKSRLHHWWDEYEFVLREGIYTDGEVKFEFKEY